MYTLKSLWWASCTNVFRQCAEDMAIPIDHILITNAVWYSNILALWLSSPIHVICPRCSHPESYDLVECPSSRNIIVSVSEFVNLSSEDTLMPLAICNWYGVYCITFQTVSTQNLSMWWVSFKDSDLHNLSTLNIHRSTIINQSTT